MAKIFEKVKNLIKTEPETKAEEKKDFDFSVPEDPTLDSQGRTPAQRQRREDLLASISEGHELPSEYEGLTRDSAKEQLRQRIEERISTMDSDEDALARIAEERERQRQEYAQRRASRRKRREKAREAQATEMPVITETAIFAKFEEPERTPSPELESIIPRDTVQMRVLEQEIKESEKCDDAKQEEMNLQLEGQVAIKDLNEEIKQAMAEEESRRTPEPAITEQSFKALFEKEEDFIDRIYVAIKKAIAHVHESIKQAWIKVRDFFRGKYHKILEKRNPEKAQQLTMNLELKDQSDSKFKQAMAKVKEKLKVVFRKIVETERKCSDKLAHWITRVDRQGDINAKKAEKAMKVGTVKAHRFRHWLDVHKRGVLMSFSAVVAGCLIIVSAINWCTAYEYAYNGKTLGVVKEQENVLEILDIVSAQLSKEHNAEVFIDKNEDISFKKVWNIFGETDSEAEVLRRLTYMQDMSVIGYSITVEGTAIAIVDSEDTAKGILEEVKQAYAPTSEYVQYEDVDFAEKIDIVPTETKLGRLYSHDDALYKILTGAEEKKSHIVQPGETFSTIAKMYGMSQADLQASNPTITPNRLSIGQEIILTQAVPLLTVQTVEICNYVEYIPFTTSYQDSSSMYQGETTTKRKGEYGERTVTAKIVRNNGLEVAKLELDSAVTKQPVEAIVVRGTKALPAKKGTGKFTYPVSGFRLTSTFGQRWGRMHYGVDLACPTGTKIRASDGGTVIFAGYSGSYGYVVKIDHGGGYVTVYAHCSKILVHVGEAVYQGQHIANVGSTGRSTGPHCHFEVQYLGVQKNPLNYL